MSIKSKGLRILQITAAVFLFSCSNIQVNLDGKLRSQLSRERRLNYFFWGLVSKDNIVKNSELCGGSELIEIKYYSDFYDVAANYFTIGIWSPKKIEYQCENDELSHASK